MKLSSFVFVIQLCVLVFAFSSVSAAEVTKWVDENGKVHYGERAPDQAEKTVVKSSVSVVKASTANDIATLYSTATCGFCKQARAFMDSRGIRYREVDIERSTVGNKRYQQLGGKGVPFLVRGDESIQGFNQERYTAFFDLL